ncbi:MAG TPA: amino acid permease, partial [Steroidobacteraceae bacterium]
MHVPATPISLRALASASTIALFAMLGVECAAVPAGKVRDPARTVPRATFAGTALVALIYLLISAIPLLLIPQNELASSSAPFADLL